MPVISEVPDLPNALGHAVLISSYVVSLIMLMKRLIPLLTVLVFSSVHASQHAVPSDKREKDLPLVLVLADLDEDVYEPGHNVTIDQRFGPGEAPTTAVITVKVSGFLDDSVSGYQVQYAFEKQADRWVMADKKREINCQPGRAMSSGRCS